jgi:hypothetical protein
MLNKNRQDGFGRAPKNLALPVPMGGDRLAGAAVPPIAKQWAP